MPTTGLNTASRNSAETRMLAAVGAQIDVGGGALEQRQHGAFDTVGVAEQREHRAVVRRIRRMVEQADTRYRADRRGHRRDDLGTPSLADVGNALDDWRGWLYNPAILSWRIRFAIS